MFDGQGRSHPMRLIHNVDSHQLPSMIYLCRYLVHYLLTMLMMSIDLVDQSL